MSERTDKQPGVNICGKQTWQMVETVTGGQQGRQ